MKKKAINPRSGSDLKSFLKEEKIYREVVATAEREIRVWKSQSAMTKKKN